VLRRKLDPGKPADQCHLRTGRVFRFSARGSSWSPHCLAHRLDGGFDGARGPAGCAPCLRLGFYDSLMIRLAKSPAVAVACRSDPGWSGKAGCGKGMASQQWGGQWPVLFSAAGL